MCLAVYALTGGRLLQGRMVMRVAQRLGITFDQATADKTGLVTHGPPGSVSLTEKGRQRGSTA